MPHASRSSLTAALLLIASAVYVRPPAADQLRSIDQNTGRLVPTIVASDGAGGVLVSRRDRAKWTPALHDVWVETTDGIFYDRGSVGIGTDAPKVMLDVRGPTSVATLKVTGAATVDGEVVTWGDNSAGQCDVPGPNAGFFAVAAGPFHSLGLKSDGSVVAWGDNHFGQCDVPSPNADFVAIAASLDDWSHSVGLKSDGSIVAWGENCLGQCNVPQPNSGFVAVGAGDGHTLGVKSKGVILAWGRDDEGQCEVPAPNSDFIAVTGGTYHSLGLRFDGSIVAWGRNDQGQCTVPVPNTDFVAVAAGPAHSLGLKSDGSIVAWGWNGAGECNVPAPNRQFVAVAAGANHSLGLKCDGSVVAWGWNGAGQCNVPAPNTGFVAIAGGDSHSLAIRRVPAARTSLDVAGVVHSTSGGFKFPDGTVQKTAAPAGGGLPLGAIVMWSGDLAAIPSGWRLCDGSGGTPDLRDRFIMSASPAREPATCRGPRGCTFSGPSAPRQRPDAAFWPGPGRWINSHLSPASGGAAASGAWADSGHAKHAPRSSPPTCRVPRDQFDRATVADERVGYCMLAFIMKVEAPRAPAGSSRQAGLGKEGQTGGR